MKFNLGDRLKWSKSHDPVVVVDVNVNGKIGIILPNQQVYLVDKSELSPLFTPKFKVGDRVILDEKVVESLGYLNWLSQANDNVGTITNEKHHISNGRAYVRIKWDNGHINNYLEIAVLLAPVIPAPTFKVGNRVKILPTSRYAYQSKDATGTIIEKFIDIPKWIKVKWDGGITDSYPVQDLIPVETHIPTVEVIYDEKTNSAFIVFDKKATVCVPELSKREVERISTTHRHDDDEYNKLIGKAVSYYRCFGGK